MSSSSEPLRDPLGMSLQDWERWAREQGLPSYRGLQIFEALCRRGARDYAEIRVLPRELRERLSIEIPLRRPEIVRRDAAADGSAKYGLRLADGALVEAVFMPGERSHSAINEFADARAVASGSPRPPVSPSPRPSVLPFTVCLSSQTGCAVDCAFCVTGRLGAGRNLAAGEILGQLDAVLEAEQRTMEGARVVFMGMGEPFLNPEGVLPALDILYEQISPRRVTVSTSGVTPAFALFAARPRRPNLAVSINAADDETRSKLMPITRIHCLASVVEAMRQWPIEPRRRITAEYVLIAGVNDASSDADRLARLLSGMPVKVNVIPLNEDPVYLPGWKRPDEGAIERFVARLAAARTTVTVRRSRGPDAQAACGQLKGRTEDIRRRSPAPPPTPSRKPQTKN